MIKKLIFTAALLAPCLAHGQPPSADVYFARLELSS